MDIRKIIEKEIEELNENPDNEKIKEDIKVLIAYQNKYNSVKIFMTCNESSKGDKYTMSEITK